MAYKFRFQRVLDYRRHQAEIVEMELAQTRQLLVAAETDLQNLEGSREATLQELAHRLQKGLDGVQVHLWRLYVSDLESCIAQQSSRVETLRQRVAEVRERLVEATRKKKAMEHLHSREQQARRRTEERREVKELNELSIQGVLRRMS